MIAFVFPGQGSQKAPVVANADASPKRSGSEAIEALVVQVSAAVRWEESVRRLASDGITTYVEVGPGRVLGGLIRKIHRDSNVAAFGAPEDLDAVRTLIETAC